jgi:hypothetical protein
MTVGITANRISGAHGEDLTGDLVKQARLKKVIK